MVWDIRETHIYQEAFEEGRALGQALGREEGRNEVLKPIALRMLGRKYSIRLIARLTGLTPATIRKWGQKSSQVTTSHSRNRAS